MRAEFLWSPGVEAGGCCWGSPSIPPLPPLLLLAPLPLLVELATTWLPDTYMGTEPLLATACEVAGVLTWAAVPAAS